MSEPNLNIDPPDRHAPVRRIVWLTLLTAIVVVIGAMQQYRRYKLTPEEIQTRKTQAFPGKTSAIFENASQITLYSLEGSSLEHRISATSRPGQFHGHPILGQTVLSGADKERVVPAIYGGFAERRIFRAACFVPHHGLRAVQGKQSVDLVICFGCTTLVTFSAGQQGSAPITHAPEKYLNRLLRDAGAKFDPAFKP